MAQLNESQQWLYNELKSANIELGTEDEYFQGLSDENTRKWLYDTAKEAGYDMGTPEQFHAAFTPTPSSPSPAAPAEPQQPQDKGFGQRMLDAMGRVAGMNDSRGQAFYQMGAAVNTEEKEAAAERERMAAATLPLSDNDRQREQDMAHLRSKMMHDRNNREAYSQVMQQLENETPSYMKGEDVSPDDVARRYAEAWGANTPEGQQAVQTLNQRTDEMIAGFRTNFEQSQQFKDIRAAITQQYRSGQLTQEEAEKQLNEQLNAAFMQQYGKVVDDEKRSLYAAFMEDARKHDNGYIKRESERIMSQQVNSLVDEGLANVARLRHAEVDNFKSQLDMSVPGSAEALANYQRSAGGGTLGAAAQLYQEAATRMADTKKGEATFGSVISDLGRHMLDKVRDLGSFGMSELASSIEQKRVLSKIANANAYDNPETVLSDEEEALYDAITAKVAAELIRSENTSHWANAAALTADMLPFVRDIMLGQELLGGFTQAGKDAIIRGVARKLTTGSWGRVIGKLVANVGVTAMGAAESAVIAAIAPSTYALGFQNMAKADAGSISFNDGVRLGNIEQQGAASAFYQAYDTQVGELFTETGGNTQLMMRALQASPVGRYLGGTSLGKMMRAFDKSAAGQLLSKGAYNGIVGEMSEEWENTFYDACKAAFHAPSGQGARAFADTYGEFVSADTQVPMLISFSIPAILGGAVSAGQYVKIQRDYKKAYEQMQQTLGSMGMSEEESMRMLDEFRGGIYTGNIDDIPAAINSMADAYGRTQEDKERLVASLSQYAVADANLAALQTAHANEQSRVKELYRDVERAEQQIDGMTNKEDGTIYHVGIKGKNDAVDGYITAGNVTTLVDSEGNPRFSGNDVVTVRFADGNVQQMSASQLALLEAPEKGSDRLSNETKRLEAKWHNIDAFPAGSQVNVTGPMPMTTSVADVNDEGVTIDIVDENGMPNQTTIPHEEAAQILEAVQPNPDAVAFADENGETIELIDRGEGIFETAQADENGQYYTYTAEDLAEMGLRPVGEQQPSNNGQPSAEQEPANQEQPSVPMGENGNPAWDQITPADAANYILSTYQGNKAGAVAYADDMLAEATKVQKQAAKQKAKNLNLAQRMQEEQAIKQMRQSADDAVHYWEQAKLAIANTKTEEEQAAEAERQAKMQAERQQRKQTQVGTGEASMKEKFDAAPKVYGNKATITLPDGRVLSGQYVLTTAYATTPSHDPFNNFQSSEGYPTKPNGENINDRNYKDKEEQQKVYSIAQNYNGMALRYMPVIGTDGMLFDGNGRDQARKIAASNGTDAAYIEDLKRNAQNYGVTAGQVADMPQATMYFQLDEDLPHNTSSLVIFNEQVTQTQSNTGKAAAYARKLTPEAISMVVDAVKDFDTMDAFFNHKSAPFELINDLINAGVIGQREKAEMVDGDRLSATGRERLSNILFGTVFDDAAIHLMGDDAGLKNSIMRALPQILDNKDLGEFSLESDINDAIRLLYEVRQSKMPFRSFVSQTVISDDGQTHTAAENYSPFQLLLGEEMTEGGVDAFRDVLATYNSGAKAAKGDQLDIFGNVTGLGELQQLVLQRYGKETKEGANAGSQVGSAAQSTQSGDAEVTDGTVNPDGMIVGHHYTCSDGSGLYRVVGVSEDGRSTIISLGIKSAFYRSSNVAHEALGAVKIFKEISGNELAKRRKKEMLDENDQIVYDVQYGIDIRDFNASNVGEIAYALITGYEEHLKMPGVRGETVVMNYDNPTDSAERVFAKATSDHEALLAKYPQYADAINQAYAEEKASFEKGQAIWRKYLREKEENASREADNGTKFVGKKTEKSTKNEQQSESGAGSSNGRNSGNGVRESSGRGVATADNGSTLQDDASWLASQPTGDLSASSHARQEQVSEQLISRAKENGTLIPVSQFDSFGQKVTGKTGESVVYIDEANNRVVKIKDPFAKAAMKGDNPQNILAEVIAHNLLFPNTAYTLLGYADNGLGDVQLVLAQPYIDDTFEKVTDAEVERYLTERGFHKRDNYTFTDGMVTITDVTGENVLKNADGELFFIDPIIGIVGDPNDLTKKYGTRNSENPAVEQDTYTIDRSKEDIYSKSNLDILYERIKSVAGSRVVLIKFGGTDPWYSTLREDADAIKGLPGVEDYSSMNNESLVSISGKKFDKFLKAAIAKGLRFAISNGQDGKIENAGATIAAKQGELQLEEARQEVNTNPTEAQKKAGNYKMGHVNVAGFDITIENPKGSTRSGKDKGGKKWSIKMQHDYGYFRGTEGVDGDHIDTFIGPNLESQRVYVVDQVDPQTGEFDEHKCLLGFDSMKEAREGYLSNYEKDWKGLGAIYEVTLDDFHKWIESSHRKTKPFGEYKSVKREAGQGEGSGKTDFASLRTDEGHLDWAKIHSMKTPMRDIDEELHDAAQFDKKANKKLYSLYKAYSEAYKEFVPLNNNALAQTGKKRTEAEAVAKKAEQVADAAFDKLVPEIDKITDGGLLLSMAKLAQEDGRFHVEDRLYDRWHILATTPEMWQDIKDAFSAGWPYDDVVSYVTARYAPRFHGNSRAIVDYYQAHPEVVETGVLGVEGVTTPSQGEALITDGYGNYVTRETTTEDGAFEVYAFRKPDGTVMRYGIPSNAEKRLDDFKNGYSNTMADEGTGVYIDAYDGIAKTLEEAKQKAEDARAEWKRKQASQEKERAAAEKKAEEEAAEKERIRFGGFTDGKSPMQVARIAKALDKKYRFDGQVMSVAERIQQLYEEGVLGTKVFDEANDRKSYYITRGDGMMHDFGKIGYDYANWLLNDTFLEGGDVTAKKGKRKKRPTIEDGLSIIREATERLDQWKEGERTYSEEEYETANDIYNTILEGENIVQLFGWGNVADADQNVNVTATQALNTLNNYFNERRRVLETSAEQPTSHPAQESTKAEPEVSQNTIFTESAADRARERMRARLGRLNAGLDPEMLSDGIIVAGYYIERGARTFAAYAKAMIKDFGDAIRPYLKGIYTGLSMMPEAKDLEMEDMMAVAAFDIDNFDPDNEPEPPTGGDGGNGGGKPASKFQEGDEVTYKGKSGFVVNQVLANGTYALEYLATRGQFMSTILSGIAEKDLESAKKSPKGEEKSEKALSNQKNLVPLQGKSVNLDTADWRTYMTDEAKEQLRDEKLVYPQLGFIPAASKDGVKIPAENLLLVPEIKKAQEKIDAIVGSLEIDDEEKSRLADRLRDEEHGSAVFTNGKIRKVNGTEDFSGEVEKGRHACIVIGRAAGGKSSVFANPLSNQYKARLIDSDVVKPWLDGFDGGNGAGYVQEASSQVADLALERAISEGENVVIPKVGGGAVVVMAVKLRLAGYTVSLYYNEVSEASSIMRAAARFAETGRYLSISYLSDKEGEKVHKAEKTFKKYANATLKQLQDEKPELFVRAGHENAGIGGRTVVGAVDEEKQRGESSELLFVYAEWKSNDVAFGEPPVLVWSSDSTAPIPGTDSVRKDMVMTAGEGMVGSIRKGKHTKTGKDLWIVNPAERLSDADFKDLKKRARENGGYYSKFKQNSGFIFESEDAAIKFNNLYGESITTEEYADSEAARNEGRAISREGEAYIDGAGSAAEEATEGTNAESVEEPISEAEVAEQIAKVDDAIQAIDDQLAILGALDTTDGVNIHVLDVTKRKHEEFLETLFADLDVVRDGDYETTVEVLPRENWLHTVSKLPTTLGITLCVNTKYEIDEDDNVSTFNGVVNIQSPEGGNQETIYFGYGSTYQELIEEVSKHLGKYRKLKKRQTPLEFAKEKKQKPKAKKVPEQATMLSLFDDDLEPAMNLAMMTAEEQQAAEEQSNNPETIEDNGSSDSSVPPQDGGMGEGEQQTAIEPEQERVGTGSESDLLHDGERSGSDARQHVSEDVTPTPKVIHNKNNFHNSRGKSLAPTTLKARFDANVAAIRLMRELTESGKKATAKDKAILAQYSGWGGLGTYFNNRWSPEYKTIHELFDADELHDAENSINTAYYTPTYIIDYMWDIVSRMGFKGGDILEGSAGIGNILAQIPTAINQGSTIQAVELDQTSGNILRLLYPDAQVNIDGFQNVDVRPKSKDLVITNVPFDSSLKLTDEKNLDITDKFGLIHNFCIAKNVRALREGGIGVFITTSGTLDKAPDLFKWLGAQEKTDVVGAFRLNNKTFDGAPVTSDIIVVRKRINGERSPQAIDVTAVHTERIATYDENPYSWRQTKEKDLIRIPITYNNYFVEHPEHMGGVMMANCEMGDTFRPKSIGLHPQDGKDQAKLLKAWVNTFAEQVQAEKPQEEANREATTNKEGSLLVNSKGEICVSQSGAAVALDIKHGTKVGGRTKTECLRDYQEVRDALNAVLDYQANNADDNGLKPLLDRLNAAYDLFHKRYGNFHKNNMLSWLRNDVDYSAVAETEVYKESEDAKGKKTASVEKADVMKGRVLRTKTEQKASNVRDGIVVSIREKSRIDLGYMASLLGRSMEDVRSEALQTGLAFEDPASGDLVVKYEYLSGNVLDKLEQAKACNTDGRYDDNVRELERVCPKTIPAHMIKVSFGSTWVPANLYKEYIAEKTGIPAQDIRVQKLGAEWSITFRDGAEYTSSNTSNGVHSQQLNMTIPVHRLIIAAINNGSVAVSKLVSDIDGKHTEVDKEATQVCNSRIDQYKDEFVTWFRDKMQADPEMSAQIESDYNKTFNQFVPARVSKEFIPEKFDGSNQIFKLNEWQSQAAVRCTMEPLMIAHEVGTGKTFTMITSAMEMRRLGLAKKPMIVVQNATVQQFVADARRLYPRARILSMTDKDKGADGRAAFYRKIKYNDWDIIIITQSAFNMIPESQVRKEQYIQEKIEEKEHIIELLEAEKVASTGSDARTIDGEIKRLRNEITNALQSIQEAKEDGKVQKTNKQAKKQASRIESITEKAKRQLARKTDDVESFDDMDIDALFVDEAHEYKHLGFESMTGWGIKGIDKTASGKAVSLYCKMQAVFDKTGHKNVVFATGTPISNTAAEIWTFMKYLMPKDVLKANQIYYFDDFVHNFGKITQRPEFKTNGSFKEVTRFAEYNNVPELVRMWTRCSDTVLEPAGLKDKVPETEAGSKSAQDIFLPQTRALRSVMKYVRERLEEYEQMDGAKKKENSHIPLTMYGIAMRAAIDPRLVLDAADEPTSKTNRAVDEIVKALDDSRNYNGTVAVFCDSFQRKVNDVVVFNLFEDIREKLIARGIPAEQIAIISNQAKEKKQQIFDKVNAGEIRVILGSTQKLGVGVNIQTRLFAEIHLDAPNRPMDYQQRVGRIIRQGNLHKEWGIPVRLIRFGVEDSLDVTGYQRLKTKTSFSTAIMKNANDMNLDSQIVDGHENRSMEEDESAAEFDNMIATISGSEFAILKSDAERKLRKLEAEKKQFEDNRIWLADAIKRNKYTIKAAEERKAELEDTLGKIRKAFPDGKPTSVIVAGKNMSSDKVAEETYKKLNKAISEKIDALRQGGVSAMQYSGNEYKPLTTVEFELNGVKGHFRVMANVSTYSNSTDVRTYHDVTIPQLGIEQEATKQRFIKGDLETVLSWMDGKGQEARIRDIQYRIDTAKKENESHEEKLTRTFDKDDDIAKLQADVDMFTEKMKAEMEAKEAKYRELDKEVESINLGDTIDLSDDDEDDAEKQYGDGYDNDTEAQQLATEAVLEALENAGINVVMEQEDAELAENAEFSIRKGAAPKKTGIGYKVFYRGKDGKLYPPMVANPNGADTPVGVWLNADAAPVASLSKTGRPKVKAGGKGTQGGGGQQLAYRPGWHLGEIPYAIQFNRMDENGNKTLFPKDFVWAEVEYAADVDYQKDAEAEGMNANGKFQHSLAGLKRVPEDGYYRYRTNPNPATDPWIITGAMKVNRVLTNDEVDEIVRKAGREPQLREMSIVGGNDIFVSNAAAALGRIKQEKATPEQWLAMLTKEGGIKAGEDKWMGLSDWLRQSEAKTLTKGEVMQFVRDNAIQIEEVKYGLTSKSLDSEAVFDRYREFLRDRGMSRADVADALNEVWYSGADLITYDGNDEDAILLTEKFNNMLRDELESNTGDRAIERTRLEYTTTGLTNKREIALTIPTIEPWNQTDNLHFGDAGNGRAVAWVRFGETTIPTDYTRAKRAIESFGYSMMDKYDADENSVKNKLNKEEREQYELLLSELRKAENSSKERVLVIDEIQSKRHQEGREHGYKQDGSNTRGVPDAPFDKNWPELAFKRMLRLAAEEGYDRVAWTTGKQQADRYGLRGVVEEITVSNEGYDYNLQEWDEMKLRSVNILLQNENRIKFDINGEGQIISSVAGQYDGKTLADVVGKEMAVKILSVKDEDFETTFRGGDLEIGGEGMKSFYDQMLPSFVKKYVKKWGATVEDVTLSNVEKAGRVMHSVTITPEMRESVMQGQPQFLYRTSGTVLGWADNTGIHLTPDGVNPNTPIHEYTHLWAKAMELRNPEGWESIKSIFRNTPFWDEVVNDVNYRNIRNNEDRICSEVLARYSGKRGAERMTQTAQELLDEAKASGSKRVIANTTSLLRLVKEAIQSFWNWVGHDLFGIHSFKNAEEVADRVLYDLVNGTDLSGVTYGIPEFNITPEELARRKEDLRKKREANPYPVYQLGETLEHYQQRLNEWKAKKAEQDKPDPDDPNTPTPPSSPVPPVPPRRNPRETAKEFSNRLKAQQAQLRDELAIADYTGFVNDEASKMNNAKRLLIDAASPIEHFQEYMLRQGAIMNDESNAYADTFLASGRVSQTVEELNRDVIRPMASQIARLMKKYNLEDFGLTWHNLDVEGTGQHRNGDKVTAREFIGLYTQAKDAQEAEELGLPDRGQAGFKKHLDVDHKEIIRMMESIVAKEDIDKLWELINKATKFALVNDYEAGRISKDVYEENTKRKYYVPQRGWRERDEEGIVTEYLPNVGKRYGDPYNAALVKAKGRTSLASDPFQYIMSIDHSSIVSSENNKIKQKFLEFCLLNEHLGIRTDAFHVKRYWIMNVLDADGNVQYDADGNAKVELSYSQPDEKVFEHDKKLKQEIVKLQHQLHQLNKLMDSTPEDSKLNIARKESYRKKSEDVSKKIAELEDKMQIAWTAFNSTLLHRTSGEKPQHWIDVKKDGQLYTIEVRDEKLANAINKSWKQNQTELFSVQGKIRNATRVMSAMLTQYNPEFALSNFARDYQVAVATIAAEHPTWSGDFAKNFAKCQRAVAMFAANDKVRNRTKYVDGEVGKYLQEYMRAGAATGFSYMQDLKALNNDFEKMINEGNLQKGLSAAAGVFSMLTEMSETSVRFAGYMTARQHGMGVNEAAYLAKELTTNFDRAGEMANSGWMSWFSFFRATMNGNIKFFRAFKKMPLHYAFIGVGFLAAGILNQLLNPNDPDDEIWVSDYMREGNFVIGKVRIPTAHFLRMFFAAGVNIGAFFQGSKTWGKAIYDTADYAMSEMLPNYVNVGNATEWNDALDRPDFTGAGLLQGFMPTTVSPIADIYFNRDYKGATINREPFAKSQEGTKDILLGKENTAEIYKVIAQGVYEAVGGDMNSKYQSDDPAWRSWLFDVSPSSLEHATEGYLAMGGAELLIQVASASYSAVTGKGVPAKEIPFLRKFYNSYDTGSAYRQQYYLLNGRVKEFDRNLKDYKKNNPTKYNQVVKSQQYKLYEKDRQLLKTMKENPTKADVKQLYKANQEWWQKRK